MGKIQGLQQEQVYTTLNITEILQKSYIGM